MNSVLLVMSLPSLQTATNSLDGVRIALVGRLASMSRRDAQQLIREHGGQNVERADGATHLVVVGDEQLALLDELSRGQTDAALSDEARAAVERGELQIIGETELWRRLGLVDAEQHIQRLYTPAMLADLLDVTVAVVRRWHRRGLIKPVREVRKLPYFDFQEVSTARRLAELLASGISPTLLEKRLAEWARYLPKVERPLAQLSVIVRGKQLLLKEGAGLVAPDGQRWFEFAGELTTAALSHGNSALAGGTDTGGPEANILSLDARSQALSPTAPPDVLLQMAEELEDDGELSQAADLYRAALAAGGPNAAISFALAEVLYRLGDTSAARERYYVAIELDEDYVEARANLGCLLAELGQLDLAVAAFEGALVYHHDYPDVHYHLAQTLHELGRTDEAGVHWRMFLQLAPDSPWAAEARRLLSHGDM